MKKRFLMLLLALILGLTACGAEKAAPPEDPPAETVGPEEEPPENIPPEEGRPEGALPPLEGTPLTEEELARADEAFNCYGHPSDKARELGCFFTSTYADVTELNLEEFLRYYFNGSSEVTDEDGEEFRALAALDRKSVV